MKSAFKEISLSIFDVMNSSAFDDLDLDIEEKVIISDEMRTLVRDEIVKRIGEIPLGSLISAVIKKEIRSKMEKDSVIEKKITEIKTSSKDELEKVEDRIEKLNKQLEEATEKLKKKYDDLKSDVMTIDGKQWYQFGGFSPQSNILNIGDPSVEGSWRIVISGSDLSVERFESETWVQKGAFNP